MAPAHGRIKTWPTTAAWTLLLGGYGCSTDTTTPEPHQVHKAPPDGSLAPDNMRKGVPAISGGTLALSADGKYAVAADSDRDLIYSVELASQQVKVVKLTAGSEPGRVALDTAGRAHVVLRGAGGIASIDVASGTLLGEHAVCALPRGIALDPKGDALFVACGDGSLVSLATADRKELSRVRLDRDLRDVVFDRQGRMYVSRYRSAELLELSSKGELIARRTPGHTTRSPNGLLGVSLPAGFPIEAFDAGTALLGPEDAGPSALALDGGIGLATPDAQLAFPAQFDAGPGSVLVDPVVLDAGAVAPPSDGLLHMSPTLAWRTLLNADGEVVMLHERAQIDEVVIESGGYGSGGCDTIAQVGFSFLVEGSLKPGVPLTGATLAVDAAFSQDGKWIAVAAAGEINLTSQGAADAGVVEFEADGITNTPSGSGGGGGAVFGNGGSSGINNGTISVYSTDPSDDGDCQTQVAPIMAQSPRQQGQAIAVISTSNHQFVVLSREPAQLEIYDYDTASTRPIFVLTTTIPLSSDSVKDPGHDLFHGNAGGGLACASCHGEGTDDGHIWNFAGVGPRRTQNMRGGLLATQPFHWEGDLHNMRALMNEVFTSRMNGFGASDDDVKSLGDWLDSLPALHAVTSTSDAAVRGKALFESSALGCASCHSGEHLTNNQNADVGTGGSFQVPPLHGLSARAPYMHDGCAKTLADRFLPECGGGDKHGHTSQLSASQLADLTAYLDTL